MLYLRSTETEPRMRWPGSLGSNQLWNEITRMIISGQQASTPFMGLSGVEITLAIWANISPEYCYWSIASSWHHSDSQRIHCLKRLLDLTNFVK